MKSGESLEAQLQYIEKRLAELSHERESLLCLREKLIKQQVHHELTPSQKISIFRKYFRGRDDIHSVHWENAKGKSGYSVACQNEWVPKLCNKPRIKCSECVNRAFKALDDNELYAHLSGKKVLGLYPLLPNDSCYLLAVDFDKDEWRAAVSALSQACKKVDIPHAIEISKSGNGAHLWIFFTEQILASKARRLGFLLLDQAMEIQPNISFDSYDRLFPNQDLMPEGGFGNLIALPLQLAARKEGKTVFVDESFRPYPNQWDFLGQLKKVSNQQVNELIGEEQKYLGSLNQMEVVDDVKPWEQSVIVDNTQIENCPESITITLANHVYIKLSDIPKALAARIKKIASFSNPVFFKTQAMRFSTHGIPRYISCARIESGYLSVPRGCLDDVVKLIEEQNIIITYDDKRSYGDKLKGLKFLGELRNNQKKAVNTIIKYDAGILHAPTAFGKTVAAVGIVFKRKVSTLILTHSLQLLEQWKERLGGFLTGVEVGVIRGGKKKPSKQIDIATYQSLINKKDNTISSLVRDYGQIIIDECHHISAPKYECVLNEVFAKYIVGLTATPDRQDGHQKIMFMLAGPVRHRVDQESSNMFEQRVIVKQFYYKFTDVERNLNETPKISDIYGWLSESEDRTLEIVIEVVKQIEQGKMPIVLTERREHAEKINMMLLNKGLRATLLKGGMSAGKRKEVHSELVKSQVVVATGKYVGEGFDLPKLDTLFLAMPIAWKGTLAQYAGRIQRQVEGKNSVTIFDFVDETVPMLSRMFKKREKGYKAMGYQLIYE